MYVSQSRGVVNPLRHVGWAFGGAEQVKSKQSQRPEALSRNRQLPQPTQHRMVSPCYTPNLFLPSTPFPQKAMQVTKQPMPWNYGSVFHLCVSFHTKVGRQATNSPILASAHPRPAPASDFQHFLPGCDTTSHLSRCANVAAHPSSCGLFLAAVS